MEEPDLAPVARLCDRYGYPPGVRSLLEEITRAVAIPGVHSVVLSGSASRGELVFRETPAGVRIFSDVELSVIGEPAAAEDRARAERRIEELEQRQLAIGARTFHIDVAFTTPRAWQSPQANFQAWETRHTGWVLHGEDLREQLRPAVDPSTSTQSSLNRLWHLLLYLPEPLLRGDATESDVQVYRYALDRAVLDFPLWLLIHHDVLVAGFGDRLRHLQEKGDELPVSGFAVADLAEAVARILRDRSAPGSERPIAEHYAAVLDWYVAMLRWALEDPGIDADRLPATLEARRADIYPRLGWKRRLWELKLSLAVAGAASPFEAFRWLIRPKQAHITGFLWCMHQSACATLRGDAAAAGRWLDEAAARMDALWPTEAGLSSDADPADQWLALRRRFFDFVVRYYRGLAAKRSYYQLVMEAR